MNDFLKSLLQNLPQGVKDTAPWLKPTADIVPMAQAVAQNADMTRDLPMDTKFPMAQAPVEQPPLPDSFLDNDVLGLFKGTVLDKKSAMSEQPAIPQMDVQKSKASPIQPQTPTQLKEQPQKQQKIEEVEQDIKPQPEEDIISKLLKERERRMSSADLVEAALRIGGAIGGQGRLSPDLSVAESLRKSAERPVEDLMTEAKLDKVRSEMSDDKARRDPNSEISKLSRSSIIDNLNKIGRADLAAKVTNQMSHKQIEDLFGNYNLQNMVSTWEAAQARKEAAALRADQKKDLELAKLDDKKDKFITDRFDHITKSKIYGAMGKLQKAKETIDSALASPSGIKDIAALYEAVKSFDPESAVREGEIKLAQEAMSYIQQFNRLKTKLNSKGARVLDVNTLNQMKDMMDVAYNTTRQQYDTMVNPILAQAASRDIPERDFKLIDPMRYQQEKAMPTPKKYNVDQDAIAAELARRRGNK